MVRILFSGGYLQSLKTLIEKSPELKQRVDIANDRFRRNPADTRLNVHPLRKSLDGRYALCITDDIRIVFRYTAATTVCFLKIGPHEIVYPGYRKIPASKLNDA